MAEREIKLSMSTVRWLIGGLLLSAVATGQRVWSLYAENQDLKLELRLVELKLTESSDTVATVAEGLEALR